jgi:hypothetical protein
VADAVRASAPSDGTDDKEKSLGVFGQNLDGGMLCEPAIGQEHGRRESLEAQAQIDALAGVVGR